MPIYRESARDYVEIIKCFKLQPSVVISDVSSILASHGNNRESETFRPHDGRVAEGTEEKIEKAKRVV